MDRVVVNEFSFERVKNFSYLGTIISEKNEEKDDPE